MITIEERIYEELQILGITQRYRGCAQACLAIQLAMEDEERLREVTKRIYKEVALRCSTKTANVERNIRTVCLRAWKKNRKHLQELAGYPLYAPPVASDFISIMAVYLLRTQNTLSI